ncbi:hypothetical protein F7731_17640 [Cytobacillus depressus]|uniref:Uncharacterized protein n=1 Tax=Cytobacillus depressus TaxID=1602942 RepID=A0A6L3V6T4_9BACI|nr:hypothetical protein F7731_17640 [Cytobacillus depressus]
MLAAFAETGYQIELLITVLGMGDIAVKKLLLNPLHKNTPSLLVHPNNEGVFYNKSIGLSEIPF